MRNIYYTAVVEGIVVNINDDPYNFLLMEIPRIEEIKTTKTKTQIWKIVNASLNDYKPKLKQPAYGEHVQVKGILVTEGEGLKIKAYEIISQKIHYKLEDELVGRF